MSIIELNQPLTLTPQAAANAFAEWERRFRETPEAFATDFQKAAMGLQDYGEQATAYFFQLFLDLAQAKGEAQA